MYVGVKDVKPLPDFRLLVTFENGEKKVFNMEPFLDKGIFRELRDATLFGRVRVNFDTVERPNGADVCPEMLYSEGVPVENENKAAV